MMVLFTTLKMSKHVVKYSERMLSSLFPVLVDWGAGTFQDMYATVPGSRCRTAYGRRNLGGKVHPDVLYFTVGMGKACLAATKWIPV